MNNLTFGNDRVQYYETVASGSGAGDGFDGADAVQTHMTNSRLTDPEVLEWRYPVRVDSFAVRDGSGGTGRWHGGRGVVREHPIPRTHDGDAAHRPPEGAAVRHGGRRSRERWGEPRCERADGSMVRWRGSTRSRCGPRTSWSSRPRAAGDTGSGRGDARSPVAAGRALFHGRLDRMCCGDAVSSAAGGRQAAVGLLADGDGDGRGRAGMCPESDAYWCRPGALGSSAAWAPSGGRRSAPTRGSALWQLAAQ